MRQSELEDKLDKRLYGIFWERQDNARQGKQSLGGLV